MATLDRQSSLAKVQYTHAIYSKVQVDGAQENLASLDPPEPWILESPSLISYDFQSERRVLDHIQEKHALEESEALAKKDRVEESRKHRQLLERQAAERAQQARMQAERQRKQAEEERILQQKSAIEQLTAEQQKLLRQFDNIAGTDSDIQTRIAFLRSFKWDLELTVASFFEFEGDLSKVVPVVRNVSPEPSPNASKAYIQFVFPDGKVELGEFRASDTLWIVFTWIYPRAKEVGGQNGILLQSSDGKIVYQEPDYDRTLFELCLAPRGVIKLSPA